jgi:hypothetical protein
MATLAPVISDTGILGSDYSDILQQLKIIYFSIYGSDCVLDDDSQDGQFLAVIAQAIFDCGGAAIDVFNSFSPLNARGVGLSSLVKLNGLRRLVATNSQCVVTLTGVVGTPIVNGLIGDNQNLNTQWSLPALVTIGLDGTVTVTATATTAGATPASADTLVEILTPTMGWQTVTNGANVASPGLPVEKDSVLRARQSKSTALPAMTILEGVFAAVDAVSGVDDLATYQNDDDVVDADGQPPHSMTVVVRGGDVNQVASAIALKKAPGTRTNGTTSVLVVDNKGVPNLIRFYELSIVRLTMHITIHPLTGYVSTTGDSLKQAVADFVNNSLIIGEDSYQSRLYTPANLTGTGLGATYVVVTIEQAIFPAAPAVGDIAITFIQRTSLAVSDITLILV